MAVAALGLAQSRVVVTWRWQALRSASTFCSAGLSAQKACTKATGLLRHAADGLGAAVQVDLGHGRS